MKSMDVCLKKADRADFPRLKQLYLSAFPLEERAPFWLLRWKSRKPFVDFWAIYAEDRLAGLFYVANDADLSYVFYFAVAEELRGRGIGSAAIRAAVRQYEGRRLFLAVEELDSAAPNLEERIRRKAFYERNGFVRQPGHLQENTVMYEVLGVGGRVKSKEYSHLMARYMGVRFLLFPMIMTEE